MPLSLASQFPTFSQKLIQWYHRHHRDLPWRRTTDPYKIWLSEIILQQTRVGQGMPYYLRFIEQYPTVQDLARADEQEVLRLWQGLGYYSRARNMHHTARQVVTEFDGKFPNDYAGLLKLKGVGEYTAAAIASFAFNEAVPRRRWQCLSGAGQDFWNKNRHHAQFSQAGIHGGGPATDSCRRSC